MDVRASELVKVVGHQNLRASTPAGVDPDVSEVVLDDGTIRLAPNQIVLAVRPGAEDDLARRCIEAGCEVLVLGEDTQLTAPEEAGDLLVLRTSTGWTQLFVLIRTMLLSSHDEASPNGASGTPSSVHGLADAIAVMVGGSVVLYDRAHRVVAYSVQGHPIDDVRRDAILGRRTPDQWVRRFTVDQTAYQTFSEPGTVVRVDDYSDLRTRLRIAIHSGGDIIGEISVAEGNTPFAPEAEEALRRAAQLAVPAMLRHRQVGDVDALARERSIRFLLDEGRYPSDEHPAVVPFKTTLSISTLGLRVVESPKITPMVEGMAAERLLHFLSLHVRAVSPNAQVIYLSGTFYALLPDPAVNGDALRRLSDSVLRQLNGMRISANIALGEQVTSVAGLPNVKRVVDDLMEVAAAEGATRTVLTVDSHWPGLVLLVATRNLGQLALPRSPLMALEQFDVEHRSELVSTLRAYLDSFGSVSTAANRLFLHSNTLRHRLGRITDVTGLDLDDPSQRLAVSLLLAVTPQAGGAPQV